MSLVSDYTRNYIHRALTMDSIEQPDVMTGLDGEIVQSLYSAHRVDGTAGARMAWQTLKLLRPVLAEMERSGTLLIHASELKSLTKPEVMLDGYPFYRWGFNILVGASGTGKSFTALDFSGRIAQTMPVIYVVGEGLHGYAGRWEAFKAFHQMTDGEMYFHKEPVQFLDHQQWAAFRELVEPKKPELIVIDTFARCAVGIEENSAKETGQWVEAVDALRRELNCGLLIVHHTGRAGHMRGSTALYGAADAVLMQRKLDGRIIINNDQDNGGKNKHDEEAEPLYRKIFPYTVGDFAGAVLIEADRVDETPEGKITANQRSILEVIEAYGTIQAADIVDATQIARATVFRNLTLLVKAEYIIKLSDGNYIITDEGKAVMS